MSALSSIPPLYIGLALAVVAFVVAYIAYPYALHFAVRHNVYDNPEARKLQRVPIPVFGGMVVYMGILVACIFEVLLCSFPYWYVYILTTGVMLFIGVADDMKGVSVRYRFVLEIVIVWLAIAFAHSSCDNFHGLWGVDYLTRMLSLSISMLAGVGIINAINLIDGVDGYSSGYCILACSLLAAMAFTVGDYANACFALIIAGAALPFFFHNVFGITSKMFIGDGGTLMIGSAFMLLIFSFLRGNSPEHFYAIDNNLGLIPFMLAVFAIPVFDTIRVMTVRMSRGKSPFAPDRTHLHHLYIELGFSHIGTTFCILTQNALIVLAWWVSWQKGASIEMQFYLVLFLSFLSTFIFYTFVKWHRNHQTTLYKYLCLLGKLTHQERGRAWRKFALFLDRSCNF